jgi:geranylgeranyl diphosphate synthase type I
MSATLPEAVERSRATITSAITVALDRLHPRLRQVVGYHRGLLEADGTPVPQASGGKALRPALALLGAEATGRPADIALPGAVAVELVHDFSLLHDDVMDGDEERRHRPTAWTVFGQPAALLAGDALLSLATELLTETGTPAGAAALRLLTATVRELVAGQTDDLDFESRMDITFDDYIRMADGKTAALLSCSCAIGAVLAEAPAPVIEGLADFGRHLGLAFQLVDDLLGIWGSPAQTGKPVLADLRCRKKSAPVVLALAAGAPGDELSTFLTTVPPQDAERFRPSAGRTAADTVRAAAHGAEPDPAVRQREEQQLRRIAALIEARGAREEVARQAEWHLARAEQRLAQLQLPPDVEAQLLAIGRYTTARDR